MKWPLPAKAAAEGECAAAGWVSGVGAAASSEVLLVVHSAVGPAAAEGLVAGLAEVGAAALVEEAVGVAGELAAGVAIAPK